MAKTDSSHNHLTTSLVWLCRLLVGATFTVSGWAKSIDPWGFIYKLEEYFNVWGLYVPREITLALVVIVAVCEFVIGILVLTGSIRKASVWLAAAFMAVMLPLTIYIAVADPVSDCGCFGDFLIISNTETLLKNIILTGLIIYLLKSNDKVRGVYILDLQWLVATLAVAYASALCFIGYRYQPAVDFRPFPVGSEFTSEAFENAAAEVDETYIYSKDGQEKSFTVDNLPDSTWTFVRAEFDESALDESSMAIYDGDVEITDSLLNGVGRQLFLVVNDPSIQYLMRSRVANELARFVRSRGGSMIGLVAADGDRLAAWRQIALPEYPVYSVEDTSLKSLVRGNSALVYVVDGVIVLKRNLTSVNPDISEQTLTILSDDPDDDLAFYYNAITAGLVAALVVLAFLPLVFRRRKPQTSEHKRSET